MHTLLSLALATVLARVTLDPFATTDGWALHPDGGQSADEPGQPALAPHGILTRSADAAQAAGATRAGSRLRPPRTD